MCATAPPCWQSGSLSDRAPRPDLLLYRQRIVHKGLPSPCFCIWIIPPPHFLFVFIVCAHLKMIKNNFECQIYCDLAGRVAKVR